MGKFAKAAIVVLAVTVSVLLPGSGLALIAGYGAVGSIAIYSGAILALGAISKAMTPKSTLPATENRVQFRSSFASRKILMGRCASGGLLTFAHSHGTDNSNLSTIVSHGAGECDGLESLRVGDQTVTFTGNDADGKYNGFLKLWFYPGTETQVADATLVGLGGWTAAHRGDDVCYLHTQFIYDQDIWPSSLPSYYGIFRGWLCYDPRLDSTVAGGSGAHRFGDRTTWAYTVNTSLLYFRYKTDVLYGCAVPLTRMDVPSIIAATNICDELVTNKDASTTNRYECHGAIDTGARKSDNIGAILSSMGGVEVYTGGKFSVRAAAWDTPHPVTLTADDLRGPVKVTTRVSRRERYNAIRGVYVDEGDLIVTDFPPRTNATWETEDGGQRLWHDLELGWTADHRMAQRLAKIDVERARREIVVEWPGKLLGYDLKAGDTVKITLDRFSWVGKTFRIIEWALAEDGGTNMVMKEEDSSCYSWTAATDELDRQNRSTASVRAPDTLITPAGLALVATATTGAGGESIPAISVSWTSATDPFIERMLIEYRKTADAAWIRIEGADPTSGSALINNVASGTDYTVRINFVSTTGVQGVWQSDTITTAAGYTAGDAASVPWSGVQNDGARPADNADVTAANTAADTAAVSGAAAATVKAGAAKADSGLNTSGDLIRNITDARKTSSNILKRSGGGTFTGALASTVGANDDNLTGTIGTTADVLARKSTIANAVADQHVTAENDTVKHTVDGLTYELACYLHLTRSGAIRVKVEIDNELLVGNADADSEARIQLRQNGTVLDTLSVDRGQAWGWGSTYLEATGIDITDGPIELWLRGALKGGAIRWAKLRGCKLYTDFPVVDYFTTSPTQYPELPNPTQ